MAFKLIALMVVTACIALQTQAASTKKPKEHVAAVYVKDGSSGELRFLGGGLGNSQINQYITNKQDLLEQLRPTLGTGGTGGTGGGITGSGDMTGTGGVITGTVPTGTLPDTDILQQVVAQAALQQRRGPNRRRTPNRRVVNRRRPARRGGVKLNGNKQAQIYVIRQRA
ncbi:uncharacterized protein LOC135956823 [Calliphora vicina]|uniref:uncharacterized protein LOC135956823 n=1 Tax=Calliphora vicina TaxID=7373 RepID=UPI00325A5049